MKTIKQVLHERRLARLARLYNRPSPREDVKTVHDGSTATATIQRMDDKVNGIDTIKKTNDEEATRQLAKQIDDVNERIQDSHEQYTATIQLDGSTAPREDGPQCGHDVCERLYAIEQKTDPAVVAMIKIASDVDPILSMALLLVNVLEHDDADLADAVMTEIVAVNPSAGLAVLAQISALASD